MITPNATPHLAFLPPIVEHHESGAQPQPTDALSRSRRNVGEPSRYWPQNSTIKIAMYEYDMDDEYVLAVKKAASEWLPYINLKFEFVSGEEGDVRITENLGDNGGGTSALGTEALDVWPAIPTMSLPRDHRHPRFPYVVMHEFGHMLGAHHAHQHPDANIRWNMDKVYDGYKRISGLDKEGVQRNVLRLPRSSQYDLLPYDGNSVMHYEVSPHMTKNGRGQSETWSLSQGDIAWARKAYPKAVPVTS